MKTIVVTLVVSLCAWGAMAQDRRLPPQRNTLVGQQPPPRAYEDCRGKKAGDTVQHTTPEGKVAATCVDSPKGLVARPIRGKDSESKAKGTAR
jgi:hypothetical protein